MSAVQGQSEEFVDFIRAVDFAVFANFAVLADFAGSVDFVRFVDFAGSGDGDRYAYYLG